MEIGATILVGGRAHDQLIVHDEGGHVVHDVLDHLGTEDGHGIAGIFPVGFRRQHQPLGGDAGAGVEQLVSHSLQSLVQHKNLLNLFSSKQAAERVRRRVIHIMGIVPRLHGNNNI